MLPLVLLHGYPFDHTMWDEVIAHLKWKASVVAPDIPGFGSQPALEGEPSLEKMAAEIARRLEREGLNRFILAGFSMGGYVSLALAAKTPERVAGLALINSQPFADTEEVRAGRRTMIEKVKKEGVGVAVEGALGKLFAAHRGSDPKLVQFPRQGAEKAGVVGISYALEGMARRPDRTEFLETFDAPKLIIHSPEDRFIAVERIRTLAMRLSNIQYVEVPEAGHATPLEAPEAVAEALGNWAARVR